MSTGKTRGRRSLALLLTIVMIFTMLPTTTFAANNTSGIVVTNSNPDVSTDPILGVDYAIDANGDITILTSKAMTLSNAPSRSRGTTNTETDNVIMFGPNLSGNLTLAGLNINAGARNSAAFSMGEDSTGIVTIIIPEGYTTKLTGGSGHAGFEKNTTVGKAVTGSLTFKGPGELIARGGAGAAGIGSAAGKSAGNITIAGGTITSYGGDYLTSYGAGAGIGTGGGYRTNGSLGLNITGGTVTAYGGTGNLTNIGGPGIGTGAYMLGQIDINISGGNVKAYASTAAQAIVAPGIGYAHENTLGHTTDANIVITGGTVLAQGGPGAAGIGGVGTATSVSKLNVAITGGSVNAVANAGVASTDYPAVGISSTQGPAIAVQPTNGKGTPVYLTTAQTQTAGYVVPTTAKLVNIAAYGLTDTQSDANSKLYFYFPVTTLPVTAKLDADGAGADGYHYKSNKGAAITAVNTNMLDYVTRITLSPVTIKKTAEVGDTIAFPAGNVTFWGAGDSHDQNSGITYKYMTGTAVSQWNEASATTSTDGTIPATVGTYLVKAYMSMSGFAGYMDAVSEPVLVDVVADSNTDIVVKLADGTPATVGTHYTVTDGDVTIITATPVVLSTVSNPTNPSVANPTSTQDNVIVTTSADITFDGLKIDVSSDDTAGNTGAAFFSNTTGTVVITLADNSDNQLRSGSRRAGLEKVGGGSSSGTSGKVTIETGMLGNGKLLAYGGAGAAGIGTKASGGANYASSLSGLTINGGIIDAKGGDFFSGQGTGAGIGTGGSSTNMAYHRGFADVTINGGTIVARAGNGQAGTNQIGAAGIGGGTAINSDSRITITGGDIKAYASNTTEGTGDTTNPAPGIGASRLYANEPVPSMSFGTVTVKISGGTVEATGGTGAPGIGVAVYPSDTNATPLVVNVTGGSVHAIGNKGVASTTVPNIGVLRRLSNGTASTLLTEVIPTNEAGTQVYQTTVPTLSAGYAVPATAKISNASNYGFVDTKSDENSKLYFYLPTSTAAITAKLDGGAAGADGYSYVSNNGAAITAVNTNVLTYTTRVTLQNVTLAYTGAQQPYPTENLSYWAAGASHNLNSGITYKIMPGSNPALWDEATATTAVNNMLPAENGTYLVKAYMSMADYAEYADSQSAVIVVTIETPQYTVTFENIDNVADNTNVQSISRAGMAVTPATSEDVANMDFIGWRVSSMEGTTATTVGTTLTADEINALQIYGNITFTAVYTPKATSTSDIAVMQADGVTPAILDTDYSVSSGNVTILSTKQLVLSTIAVPNAPGTTAGSTTHTVTIKAGVAANVTLKNLNIDANPTAFIAKTSIDADVANIVITIADDSINQLRSNGSGAAGLQKNVGASTNGTLTLQGGTKGNGTLYARGGLGGSGIGSSVRAATDGIVIESGVITAAAGGDLSGSGAPAGLGGGATFGNTNQRVGVTISGGTVTAIGGAGSASGLAAPGIGLGAYGSGALTLNITGGNITAVAGSNGKTTAPTPGIGISTESATVAKSAINISGGTIVATGGVGAVGIGANKAFTDFTIKITGGSVRAIANNGVATATIPAIGNPVGTNLPTNGTSVVYQTVATTVVPNYTVPTTATMSNTLATDADVSYYGFKDTVSDANGNLYFYLPVTTAAVKAQLDTAGAAGYSFVSNKGTGIKPTSTNTFSYASMITLADADVLFTGNKQVFPIEKITLWAAGDAHNQHGAITYKYMAGTSVSDWDETKAVYGEGQTKLPAEVGTYLVKAYMNMDDYTGYASSESNVAILNVTKTLVRYTVTFNNIDGTAPEKSYSQSIFENTSPTAPSVVAPEGTYFTGWTLTEMDTSTGTTTLNGTAVNLNDYFSNEEVAILKVNGNITLTAIYTRNPLDTDIIVTVTATGAPATLDTDYTQDADGNITITSTTPMTLATKENPTNVVDGAAAGATFNTVSVKVGISPVLTLSGLKIDTNTMPTVAALNIAGGTITLAEGKENLLISGAVAAGLQKDGTDTLTIKGKGKLTATGGIGGAGIGSAVDTSMSGLVIDADGGTIIATGGNAGTVSSVDFGAGAGIGGSSAKTGPGQAISLTIKNGTITATGGKGVAGTTTPGGLLSAVGIGSGAYSTGALTVNIEGGLITASANAVHESYLPAAGPQIGAPGIGFTAISQSRGTVATFNISGGTVKATGSPNAAGIGGIATAAIADTNIKVVITGGSVLGIPDAGSTTTTIPAIGAVTQNGAIYTEVVPTDGTNPVYLTKALAPYGTTSYVAPETSKISTATTYKFVDTQTLADATGKGYFYFYLPTTTEAATLDIGTTAGTPGYTYISNDSTPIIAANTNVFEYMSTVVLEEGVSVNYTGTAVEFPSDQYSINAAPGLEASDYTLTFKYIAASATADWVEANAISGMPTNSGTYIVKGYLTVSKADYANAVSNVVTFVINERTIVTFTGLNVDDIIIALAAGESPTAPDKSMVTISSKQQFRGWMVRTTTDTGATFMRNGTSTALVANMVLSEAEVNSVKVSGAGAITFAAHVTTTTINVSTGGTAVAPGNGYDVDENGDLTFTQGGDFTFS